MKPNWTICVVSALIDVLQNTIYSLNLHEIWLKIHFSFIIVWKWWVIGLWNTRSSERFPSSSKKIKKKKNVGHGMIGILFIIEQQNLISRKVIWFELPKTRALGCCYHCWCLNWKELWVCMVNVAQQRLKIAVWVKHAKRNLSQTIWLQISHLFSL